MSKEEFAKAMSFLGLAYNKEFDQSQVTVWFTFFHDARYEDFIQAVKRLVVRSRFLPSIADIKQEIALISNPVLQLNASDEWEKVLRSVRKYGSYRAKEAIESLEPLTAKVVRMLGGFSAICQSTDGDWLRKNFVSLFNEAQETNMDTLSLSEPQMTLAELKRLADSKQLLLIEKEE